jgi:hypothetical protein
MDLPVETLFKILLDLPYDTIVDYCETNWEASEICKSESFWKAKADRDFQQSLELIQATTPIQKYQILSKIFTSEDPPYIAVLYHQPHLIDLFDRDVNDLANDPDVQQAIVSDLARGE